MSILILDSYDSFTYNLVHLVEQLSVDLTVKRNNDISIGEVEKFDHILLSPGPGLPAEAGIMIRLIDAFAPTKNILGVCLGMQGIVECFGGRLYNMDQVMHGVSSEIRITDATDPLFNGIPEKFQAGRYHSWAADRSHLPSCLRTIAVDDNNEVMAVAHDEYRVWGVQFHPESIMTEHGKKLIGNWLGTADS